MLREQQMAVRQEDSEEPPLFQTGDLVLLLDRGQEDWDLVLPQLLRAFRGTPHAGTGGTANLLMLGQELRLPDLLTSNPPPIEHQAHHEYTQELVQWLEKLMTC